jgi:hypothetical protein
LPGLEASAALAVFLVWTLPQAVERLAVCRLLLLQQAEKPGSERLDRGCRPEYFLEILLYLELRRIVRPPGPLLHRFARSVQRPAADLAHLSAVQGGVHLAPKMPQAATVSCLSHFPDVKPALEHYLYYQINQQAFALLGYQNFFLTKL